jgi:AbrB family looped-hinge helix DNA binding protein
MTTTTATIKGQVTIPVHLREKLHIRQGTKLKVEEKNGRIIMEPLPDDLLTAGRGMLKSKGKLLKRLLAEREAEAER